MDPLSITASIAGITMAALQSAQFLTKTIDNIRGAPATVTSISTDLRAVQPLLQSLARALQDSSSQIILSEQIKHAVENCDIACRAFQTQVGHWTKHSTEDKMFWMDRWKIALFGLEQINTFRGQISAYKGTISVALSTATMYLPSNTQIYATVHLPNILQPHHVPPGEPNERDEGDDATTE
jgi:hypothetical protein